MSTPLRAALFDFGGTLFSYAPLGASTLDLLRRGAVRLEVWAEAPELGRAYREASREAYTAVAKDSFYMHRDLFREILAGFSRRIGGEANDEFLDWLLAEQRKLLLERFELRAGCLETLGALGRQGLHLGVVSNIDDDYLGPMIGRAGLDRVLDAWTSSEEARSCKPDAAIFLRALEKAGAKPEETIFVGDSREHDVVGARALGMTTLLIEEDDAVTPGQGIGERAEPDHVIRRLSELVPLMSGRAAL